MPRRPRIVNGTSFTAAAWAQLLLVPLISGGIILAGFYYTTGDRLNQHEAAIAVIQKAEQKDRETADKRREEIRNEYFTYQQKTNEILSKLDTRLAISETKQETANQTLSKIADQLSKISSFK